MTIQSDSTKHLYCSHDLGEAGSSRTSPITPQNSSKAMQEYNFTTTQLTTLKTQKKGFTAHIAKIKLHKKYNSSQSIINGERFKKH